MAKAKSKTSAKTKRSAKERKILDRIRERRQMLGLTQAAVAKRAGWTAATWSDIEHGRFSPRLDTLLAVAKALKCSLAHLCRIA